MKVLSLAFLLLALSLPPASASPSADFIRQLIAQAAAGPSEKAKADGKPEFPLQDYVDIGHMAAHALGAPWQRMGEAEQERFLAAYRRLLERTLRSYIETMRLQQTTLLGIRPLDADTDMVATRLVLKDGKERDILWHVRLSPPLRIVDLVYDGVLVSARQRREFETILRMHADDVTALPQAIDKLTP
jgi:ABC-type transporter MlaC component